MTVAISDDIPYVQRRMANHKYLSMTELPRYSLHKLDSNCQLVLTTHLLSLIQMINSFNNYSTLLKMMKSNRDK